MGGTKTGRWPGSSVPPAPPWLAHTHPPSAASPATWRDPCPWLPAPQGRGLPCPHLRARDRGLRWLCSSLRPLPLSGSLSDPRIILSQTCHLLPCDPHPQIRSTGSQVCAGALWAPWAVPPALALPSWARGSGSPGPPMEPWAKDPTEGRHLAEMPGPRGNERKRSRVGCGLRVWRLDVPAERRAWDQGQDLGHWGRGRGRADGGGDGAEAEIRLALQLGETEGPSSLQQPFLPPSHQGLCPPCPGPRPFRRSPSLHPAPGPVAVRLLLWSRGQ